MVFSRWIYVSRYRIAGVMAVTRTEAERRIARDTGGSEDVVWVKESYGAGRSGYHEDPDCQGFRKVNELQSFSRKEAQQRLFAPCKLCVLRTADGG